MLSNKNNKSVVEFAAQKNEIIGINQLLADRAS